MNPLIWLAHYISTYMNRRLDFYNYTLYNLYRTEGLNEGCPCVALWRQVTYADSLCLRRIEKVGQHTGVSTLHRFTEPDCMTFPSILSSKKVNTWRLRSHFSAYVPYQRGRQIGGALQPWSGWKEKFLKDKERKWEEGERNRNENYNLREERKKASGSRKREFQSTQNQ